MSEDDVFTSSSTAIFASSIAQYAYTRDPICSSRAQKVVVKPTLAPQTSSNSASQRVYPTSPLKRSADDAPSQDSGSSPAKRPRKTSNPSGKKLTKTSRSRLAAKCTKSRTSGAEGSEPEVLRPLTDILADDLDSACRHSSKFPN